MAKVGDIVRFLSSVGGGKISRIEGNIAYVEDEDGFEIPVQKKDVVVINVAREQATNGTDAEMFSKFVPTPNAPAPTPEPDLALPVEEYEGGDILNLVLAYEPVNIKSLSTTSFIAYLVNDSNYFITFTYLVRHEDGSWEVRAEDTVEPNIQLRIDTFTHAQLPDMERIALQAIAYKKGKPFALKNPVNVEHRIDGTKFYKLHTFRENDYFDSPVLSYEIVKNDVPYQRYDIDTRQLQQALSEKKSAVSGDARRPVSKSAVKHSRKDAIIVDLHISELVDNTAGMSSFDMLQLQLKTFHDTMRKYIRQKGKHLVFIHGNGEGVLRKELLKELSRKYPHCQHQDASFQEYAFGATEVIIH